jgi:hypothetical protein
MDYFEWQVASYAVYDEVLLAVIALEVTPVGLHRMVEVLVDRFEDRFILLHPEAVIFNLYSK